MNPDVYGYTAEDIAGIQESNNACDAHWNNDWCANADANWEFAKECRWVTKALYGKMTGGQAIVCGVGPSLFRSFDELKIARRDGAHIWAVDRAFKPMVENGVYPQFVVTTDAGECVRAMFDFEGVRPNTIVCCSLTTHPSVIALLREKKCEIVFYGTINPFSRFSKQLYMRFGEWVGMVRSGIVVTFCAVDIAYWTGYTQIVTVGNDLCYPSVQAALDDGIEEHMIREEFEEYPLAWGCGFDYPTGVVTILPFERAAGAMHIFPRFHNHDCSFLDVSGGIRKPGWYQGSFEFVPVEELHRRAVSA
jgi:hypothetical protein